MGTCSWCGYDGATKRWCSTRCRVAGWREKRRNGALHTRAPAQVTPSAPPVVAALYVRQDGPYIGLPDVDPWDEERDATRYDGPGPIVAHPPCAPWGIYRRTSIQRADLAVRAVDQVRNWGGVLEHPAGSRLWLAMEIPEPGEGIDHWGGWSYFIRQSWFGHRAPKPTWLYIVGRPYLELPPLPGPVQDPGGRVLEMHDRERELTPPALAEWLVALARGVVRAPLHGPRYARKSG